MVFADLALVLSSSPISAIDCITCINDRDEDDDDDEVNEVIRLDVRLAAKQFAFDTPNNGSCKGARADVRRTVSRLLSVPRPAKSNRYPGRKCSSGTWLY